MEIIVRKAEEKIMKNIGVKSWPVWESPVTRFDWHYSEDETCYFIEGEVVVTHDGKEVRIQEGDIAVFPKGISCVWDVKKPVRKHYSFKDWKKEIV